MTDKEKLLSILDKCQDDFESILITYMNTYSDDFPATRVRSIISRLNGDVMATKILELERAAKISSERATYIEMYLSDKMYLSEDEAKKMIPKQLEHAREIKRVCEKIPY